MAIIRFFGRVLPPRLRITLNDMPTVTFNEPEIGLVVSIKVRINDSHIEVECDSNRFETDQDYGEVHMRAFDQARAAVDIFCFVKGIGGSLYLDKVMKADGVVYDLLVQRPDLAATVTAFHLGGPNVASPFDPLYCVVAREPSLNIAVNDLIVSISLPHHAPINCARAIETIREMLTPADEDRKKGWEAMRACARSRAFLS